MLVPAMVKEDGLPMADGAFVSWVISCSTQAVPALNSQMLTPRR